MNDKIPTATDGTQAPTASITPDAAASPTDPEALIGVRDSEAPDTEVPRMHNTQQLPVPPEPSEQWRIIGRLEGEVDVLQDGIRGLREEVGYLRKKAEKPKGKLEKTSAALAFLALIFSLLKFPSEFVAGYITKTKTAIFPENEFIMSYDSVARTLKVRWKIDVRNDGTKLDQIEVEKARILIPKKGDAQRLVEEVFLFDSQSDGLRSVDAAESVPASERVFVKEHEFGSYFCILTQPATPEQIRRLTGRKPSRRCIQLTFKGTDRSYPPVEGCFDLLPADGETLFRGESFPITFDDSLGP
jgi:hypothetical protein